MNTAKMDILVGLQWGDEGKGKFIDYICPNYDIVARFNGGANAGHTIFWNDKKITLKQLPSGIFYSHIQNVIGTGTVVNPSQLRSEIEELERKCPEFNFRNRLFISKKAQLILPTDKYWDIFYETSTDYRTIGTTRNGIGSAYSNKIKRHGFRISDIFNENFDTEVSKFIYQSFSELLNKGIEMMSFDIMMKTFFADVAFLRKLSVIDTEVFLNSSLQSNKRVLAEGAQATMLDIDHGTYPYVTSSNTIASTACVSLGVSPSKVGEVFGVFKAYVTRVGDGPFPSELNNDLADNLRLKGNEFGSNTGRPRRIGWLDLPALKYAVMLNGVTKLIMTKADVLDEMENIELCELYKVKDADQEIASMDDTFSIALPIWKTFKGWNSQFSTIYNKEELPKELLDYVLFLSNQLDVPLSHLSIGPKREDIISL